MIGAWVARYRERLRGPVRVTLYHLVESEIADRRVMRCGRQMSEGSTLVADDSPALTLRCFHCDRGRA